MAASLELEGAPYPGRGAPLHIRNRWAYAQRISGVDKSVLLALVHFDMPGEDGIFPSLATLARMTGFSRSTVQEAVKRLESDGWIKHETRHNNGKRTSSLYHIVYTGSRSAVIPAPGIRPIPAPGKERGVLNYGGGD